MKHSAEYMLEIIVNEILAEEFTEWKEKKSQWTTTISRSTKQSLTVITDLMKVNINIYVTLYISII